MADDVDALAEVLAEVIEAHQYVPSGLRGVSRCSCGLQLHGMPHDHWPHLATVLAARIVQTRAGETSELVARRIAQADAAGFQRGVKKLDALRREQARAGEGALRERIEALADLGVREQWPPDEWRAGLRALTEGGTDD